jgi:predicted DNA-binding transcriptional regulator AlpA
MDVPVKDKLLWSVEEVEAMTGMSRSSIYSKAPRPRFPGLWCAEAIRAWCRSQAVKAAEEEDWRAE